jgi:hypothetical protein
MTPRGKVNLEKVHYYSFTTVGLEYWIVGEVPNANKAQVYH